MFTFSEGQFTDVTSTDSMVATGLNDLFSKIARGERYIKIATADVALASGGGITQIPGWSYTFTATGQKLAFSGILFVAVNTAHDFKLGYYSHTATTATATGGLSGWTNWGLLAPTKMSTPWNFNIATGVADAQADGTALKNTYEFEGVYQSTSTGTIALGGAIRTTATTTGASTIYQGSWVTFRPLRNNT